MCLQKVISKETEKKNYFLFISWRSLTIQDPDPYQNYMDPQNCAKGLGSLIVNWRTNSWKYLQLFINGLGIFVLLV